jgi:hypothetical protein
MTWNSRSKEVDSMTSTLTLRAMTSTTSSQPGSPQGQGLRFDAPHDAQDVANVLRQLTLQAFHAIKPTARDVDLRGVYGEIVRLEAEIDRLGLRKLLTYTSALRRRVESAMRRDPSDAAVVKLSNKI